MKVHIIDPVNHFAQDTAGLVLNVTRQRGEPGRPGWVMTCAGRVGGDDPGALMTVWRAGVPLLWLRVNLWWDTLSWARDVQTIASPIEPIRADLVRAMGRHGPSSPPWWQAWARWFARALADSATSPLYEGTWWLVPDGVPAPMALSYVAPLSQPLCEPMLGRCGGARVHGGELVPVRPLSDPDSSRVRAWSKLLREELAPPILAIWCSLTQCYLVLDGHDRLAASLAQDRPLAVLRLVALSRQRALAPEDQAAHLDGMMRYHAMIDWERATLQTRQNAAHRLAYSAMATHHVACSKLWHQAQVQWHQQARWASFGVPDPEQWRPILLDGLSAQA